MTANTPTETPKKKNWTTPVKEKYLLIPRAFISRETDDPDSETKALLITEPSKIIELELTDEEVQSMMPDSFQELMTPKETAVYLRIPVPTVYYLLQQGKLPGISIGGRWRVKKSLLDSKVLNIEEA